MSKYYSRYSPRLTIRRIGYLSRERRKTALVIGGAILVLVAMIATQLVFGAAGWARPGVRLSTTSVGGAGEAKILDVINTEYSSTDISFNVVDKIITIPMKQAGVFLDKEATVQEMTTYPVWQRFIPFTLFTQVGKVYELGLATDKNRFTEYVTTSISPLCEIKPMSAQVRVVEGEMELVAAKDGAACSIDDVTAKVRTSVLTPPETHIEILPSAVKPVVGTDQARAAMSRAQELIDRDIKVTLMDKVHTPPKAEIASWLEFVSDEKSGEISVSVSQKRLTKFLEVLQKSIYIAPGVTTVSLVDGIEKSRTAGLNGRGVDIKKGVQEIAKQLQLGDGSVSLHIASISPRLVYDRQYTRTETGLKALVKELGKRGDVAISVREIGGRGWSANIDGDKQYTTASTYKLFVAYAVLKNIESGSMKWSDKATGGHTVSACFDTMIIHSDNPCSEWFGEKIGWKKITSMMHAVGISSRTSLYTADGFIGTTNDETNFLVKLQKGELLSASSTKRLLDVMKRQIYRAGIPAGTGAVVADKVGFLNGLLHDAAIVYTPTGSYALTIFTKGSSWSVIADMSRQIHQQLRY